MRIVASGTSSCAPSRGWHALRGGLIAALLVAAAGTGVPYGATGAPAVAGTASEKLAELPLQFISNQGQLPGEVPFYIQGPDRLVGFGVDGITFSFANNAGASESAADKRATAVAASPNGWAVKVNFPGARTGVRPEGVDPSPTRHSYFHGGRAQWRVGVPSYRKVVYRELWPGIDLVYGGSVKQLKYEFVVRPGADPKQIRIHYRGATDIHTTAVGDLVVETPLGGFTDAKPFVYQERGDERIEVPSAYQLRSLPAPPQARYDGKDAELGFTLGSYDPARTLVIDPTVFVSMRNFGGDQADYASGIALDSDGNAYVTGYTRSTEATFPEVAGPDTTHNGDFDAFIAKINTQGVFEYCGYLGGSAADVTTGVAVDSSNRVYLTGHTRSTGGTFPVAVGPDLTHNGGVWDAFVARVNAQGTAIDYCGYVGGSDRDFAADVAVDPNGRAVITGTTASTEQTFPVAFGPDLSFNGGVDAFVAAVSADGSQLEFCGYLGGAELDNGRGVDVDDAGNVYLSGATQSTEASFPVVVGPDLTHNGGWDGYVAKLTPDGTAFAWCGFFGGAGNDGHTGLLDTEIGGIDLAVGEDGSVGLGGTTNSTQATFPVSGKPDDTYNGGPSDAFIAKLTPDGRHRVFCGYFGGSGIDRGERVAIDSAGEVHLVGTSAGGLNTTDRELWSNVAGYWGGAFDAFVATVGASERPVTFCGYVPGSDDDRGGGIAVDRSGLIWVTGHTNLSSGNVADAWISRFGPAPKVRVVAVTGPTEVIGGDEPFLTIHLDRSRPLRTFTNVTFSDPSLISLARLKGGRIERSETQKPFRVKTKPVSAPTVVRVTATWEDSSAFLDVTLKPVGLSSMSLVKGGDSCTGGSTPRGIVISERDAAPGSLVTQITSDNPDVASVETGQAVIPAGERRGAFLITTQPVEAATVVTLTATLNGTQREFSLTVLPPVMQAWVVLPADVTGGQISRGQVVLDKLPAVDTVVQLSTTVPSATVPATVTIPAGVRKVKFAIRTTAVTSRETGIVSATLNGVSRTAPLSVNP